MTRPSLSDFGTHDESAYPELWHGVVGAWCPSLGPTGSRLHDFSRRNNWGTFVSMDPATDWVVDGGQYALDFRLNNNWVVADGPLQAGGPAITVSVWVRRTGQNTIPNSNGLVSVQSGNGGGASNQFNTVLAQNKFDASVVTPSGQRIVVSPNITELNKWYHFASRYDGSILAIFENGSMVNSASHSGNLLATTAFLNIGAYAGYRAVAQIDDIRIYNRPLTINEIKLLSSHRGIAYTRRTRRSFYISAGFNASWARNSNVLLGAGATC